MLIQNPPDLHELFVRFSQPKSFNIYRFFDEYERLHVFGSHARLWLDLVYPIQHGRSYCK